MENVCRKCGQPKTASKSGRLTQWVNVCICDLAEQGQDISVKMCSTCGKRINEGRKGSITQFVFRSDTCKCDKPKPIERSGDFYYQETAFEGFLDSGEDEEELAVESDKFPVDRYKPVKKLGKGAAGNVYLARDRLLGKKVAVKTLHYLTSEQLIAFQNEAKATSLLNHPSIVQILDFGVTESGTPFMVLEYVNGASLRAHLLRRKKLPWQMAVKIFYEIAKALEYSHNEGIMHRDLKPSNILIYKKDKELLGIKVIDFGIAQVKQVGEDEFDSQGNTIVGTPNYMSPDQAKGQAYTSQSEVYSLGCVLFECLTGIPPFSAESSLELMRKHAEEDVPELSSYLDGEIPFLLEKFLTKCLRKDPKDRFQSMTELRRVLTSIHEIVDESKKEKEEKADQDFEKKRNIKRPIIFSVIGIICLSGLATILYSKLDSAEKKSKIADIPKSKAKTNDFKDGLPNILDGPRLSKNNTLLLYQYGDVHAKDLEKLDLSNVQVVEMDFCSFKDDKTFEIIGSIPKLDKIVIPGTTGITAKRLKILGEAYRDNKSKEKQLKTIDFTQSDLPANALKYLAPISHLTGLMLRGTAVTNEDMKDLGNFRLNFIQIHRTNITDQGLNYISKIKSLKSLSLSTKFIDRKALANFKKENPKCKIYENYSSTEGKKILEIGR